MSTNAREVSIRRGINLSYVTILYNAFEALGSLIPGIMAGSVSLIGFGADSLIEVTSAGAAQWRLRSDVDATRRARVERMSRRIIGWSFVALAFYIVVDSARSLITRDQPSKSVFGLIVLTLSVIIMPILARAKRRVATEVGSGALSADAMQTSICAWLSLIALVGVALNALLGWWWADPLAAVGMAPIILIEGVEGIRAASPADRDPE
jgi:divalent metal cation (Fe/Co/Zn/Cd) transporter